MQLTGTNKYIYWALNQVMNPNNNHLFRFLFELSLTFEDRSVFLIYNRISQTWDYLEVTTFLSNITKKPVSSHPKLSVLWVLSSFSVYHII